MKERRAFESKVAFAVGAVVTLVLALFALPSLRAVVGSGGGDCTPAGYSAGYSVPCCIGGGYQGGGYSDLRGQFGYSDIGGYYCTNYALAVTGGGPDDSTSPYQSLCALAASTAGVSPSTARRGELVVVSGSCFGASQTVTGEFFSAPVGIGSTTTDSGGRYTLSFRVPADASIGVHRIVVSGLNPQGQRHESVGDVTVVSSAVGRTGFDLGRWIVPAIVAVLIGLLLLAATRPREDRLL